MNLNRPSRVRAALIISLVLVVSIASSRMHADTGTCGGQMITLPFTDVPSTNMFFCEIAEAFFSGLANGTTATTFSPTTNVPREQMAAFVTRTLNQSLKRGSRRAALDQYWTPTSTDSLRKTSVSGPPFLVKSDGADLWVPNDNSVSRIRASDGKLLETWTGAIGAFGVVAAKGLIFVTGSTNPGNLYQIDPTQIAGPVTLLTALGMNPHGISFDGARIWTANSGNGGAGTWSVSIVSFNPVMVTNVTTGFASPQGVLYDGANIWVTDDGTSTGKLFKLDSAGNIIQTITMGQDPEFPVFDGTNIWVPNESSSNVMVVRASTGAVIATLTGNGLNLPVSAAFDGERILVTNLGGNSVSLWNAADLTPLGSVSTGAFTDPFGACSDGLNFWVTLNNEGKIARF